MQGRTRYWLSMMLLLGVGCREETAVKAPTAIAAEDCDNSFQRDATGVVLGGVSWKGSLPNVPPFQVHAYLDYVNANRLRGERPNPHAPTIDAITHGVAEVLIVLHQIKPGQAKPWSHAPVSVEIQPEQLAIVQGDVRKRIGIVRRGAEVAFVKRDAEFHVLRARGVAFFSLPFVAADQPTSRRLDKTGMVELSEGAGYYWRRAHLIVLEHPYAALTDRTGRFMLDQVPAGDYRLTAWLPNWHMTSREHEPETAIISRITFAPAVELEQTVTVTAGQTSLPVFVFSLDQFERRR